MYSDLLFYEASDGVAEVYRTKHGSIDIDRHETGWGNNWTHIVNGQFGLPGLCQLIFYDAVSGTIRIESVVTTPNNVGGETLVKEITNWRPGWTHVVAVSFVEGAQQLFFCDADYLKKGLGVCELYNVSSSSPWLSLARQYPNMGSGVTQVVPGRFSSKFASGLAFYYAFNGTGVFYEADQDTLYFVNGFGELPATVKQVVPGNFSGGQQTDLLFYDPVGKVGYFYSVDNGGVIHILEANTGWQSDWNLIVPGNFSDGTETDLLFYSQARGVGQFYRTNHGAIAQIGLYTDWRHTWAHILAGTFAPAVITTQPPPPAIVIPSIVLSDPMLGFYSLKLTGSGFEANETVSLTLTWQDQNQAPQSIIYTTQADGSGGFVYTYDGSGGGVCIPFRRWTVVGTGKTSHRQSSPVSAGCP
ncbi:hypothetical protein P8936_07380 [Edaphobacter paludis]|uniref:Fucose-specific lectin n=1 Tax=Edaphobacter paludis TaxID=3035702 RepID=A0AAU7DD14_9BACT